MTTKRPPKPSRPYTRVKDRPPQPPGSWWIEADFRYDPINNDWALVQGRWHIPNEPREYSIAAESSINSHDHAACSPCVVALLEACEHIERWRKENPDKIPKSEPNK